MNNTRFEIRHAGDTYLIPGKELSRRVKDTEKRVDYTPQILRATKFTLKKLERQGPRVLGLPDVGNNVYFTIAYLLITGGLEEFRQPEPSYSSPR